MKAKIQYVQPKELLEFVKSLSDEDLERLGSACTDELLNRIMNSFPPIDEILEELENADPR